MINGKDYKKRVQDLNPARVFMFLIFPEKHIILIQLLLLFSF
jgi:hypothetical protein